jgi:PAS domain-containing protein
MARSGRVLFQYLLRRSSIAFILLVVTLLVTGWVLLQAGTHAARQTALLTATQNAARAALSVRHDLHAIEARLLAAQREGRPLPGIAFTALPPEVTAMLAGAEPGQLRLLPRNPSTTPELLAFLVPAQPGVATPALRIPVSALEALLTAPAGTSLRLTNGWGAELAAAGTAGPVQTGIWVSEGIIRVEASATPAASSLAIVLIPLLGLGALGFIFAKDLQRRARVKLKLAALRGSLARHAGQLSVNEARMRLTQSNRVVAERREAALIEAWPLPVALVDPEGKLMGWNQGFAALLPPDILRRDLPLGMLTRHLDIRAAGKDNGRRAPGNRPRIRATSLMDGSRIFEGLADAPAPGLNEARSLCRTEMLGLAPQLRQAVLTLDAQATRLHAHALRGLASNFGLVALVPALEALEHAAGAADQAAMALALEGFEAEFTPALRQLAA